MAGRGTRSPLGDRVDLSVDGMCAWELRALSGGARSTVAQFAVTILELRSTDSRGRLSPHQETNPPNQHWARARLIYLPVPKPTIAAGELLSCPLPPNAEITRASR